MKTLVTAQQMRELERKYMEEKNIASEELMMRAARALTAEIILRLGGASGKTCVFACGNGGNGGDGYAAARMFAENGGRSIILEVLPDLPRRPDAAQMRRWAYAHPNVWHGVGFADMPRPTAWVDCIFGIGLNRAPSDEMAALFARIAADRAEGSCIIACDIPSGVNADTGLAPGACVEADLTVTFECAKPGHYLGLGPDASGETIVRYIGIGAEYWPQNPTALCEPGDIAPICAKRARNTHKGNYGHLLIVAGSFGMAGAASFTAQAALKTGAGLVTIACPISIVPILQTLAPGAMCVPLPEQDGAISVEAAPLLRQALSGKSAVVVGPGLSRRCAPEILEAILASGLPCLIDADGLNILSEHENLRSLLHENCLLTPHPGEAARLISLPEGQIECAQALAKMGCAALYKGAATVVCRENSCVISVSGTPGMARGGSGDVLSGIAGALLARGLGAFAAGWLGSEAHGLAGEMAAQRFGEMGMTAQEIVDSLPEVWKNVR